MGEQLHLSPSSVPELRILSLWQPWASAIAAGIKRIETRSWWTCPTEHEEQVGR